MAACLSHAESLVANNPNDQSPQDLADIFCANAEKRINEMFSEVKTKNSAAINKVSKKFLNGDYTWLEEGIVTT